MTMPLDKALRRLQQLYQRASANKQYSDAQAIKEALTFMGEQNKAINDLTAYAEAYKAVVKIMHKKGQLDYPTYVSEVFIQPKKEPL